MLRLWCGGVVSVVEGLGSPTPERTFPFPHPSFPPLQCTAILPYSCCVVGVCFLLPPCFVFCFCVVSRSSRQGGGCEMLMSVPGLTPPSFRDAPIPQAPHPPTHPLTAHTTRQGTRRHSPAGPLEGPWTSRRTAAKLLFAAVFFPTRPHQVGGRGSTTYAHTRNLRPPPTPHADAAIRDTCGL